MPRTSVLHRDGHRDCNYRLRRFLAHILSNTVFPNPGTDTSFDSAWRRVQFMDRAPGYADHSGGNKAYANSYAARHRRRPACQFDDPNRNSYGHRARQRSFSRTWSQSTLVSNNTARRYVGIRESGWRGVLFSPASGHAQAADAPRDDRDSACRRGAPALRFHPAVRAARFLWPQRSFYCSVLDLRHRHAWASASRDGFGRRAHRHIASAAPRNREHPRLAGLRDLANALDLNQALIASSVIFSENRFP